MDLPPILVVEDDPVHAELVTEVLASCGLLNPVAVARDAAQARAYLQEHVRGAEGRAALPVLALLDGHLPVGSGLELLAWMKGEPELTEIPVVMLTSSDEAGDIDRARELGAAMYLVKPVGFDALVRAVRQLGVPWALARKDAVNGAGS